MSRPLDTPGPAIVTPGGCMSHRDEDSDASYDSSSSTTSAFARWWHRSELPHMPGPLNQRLVGHSGAADSSLDALSSGIDPAHSESAPLAATCNKASLSRISLLRIALSGNLLGYDGEHAEVPEDELRVQRSLPGLSGDWPLLGFSNESIAPHSPPSPGAHSYDGRHRRNKVSTRLPACASGPLPSLVSSSMPGNLHSPTSSAAGSHPCSPGSAGVHERRNSQSPAMRRQSRTYAGAGCPLSSSVCSVAMAATRAAQAANAAAVSPRLQQVLARSLRYTPKCAETAKSQDLTSCLARSRSVCCPGTMQSPANMSVCVGMLPSEPEHHLRTSRSHMPTAFPQHYTSDELIEEVDKAWANETSNQLPYMLAPRRGHLPHRLSADYQTAGHPSHVELDTVSVLFDMRSQEQMLRAGAPLSASQPLSRFRTRSMNPVQPMATNNRTSQGLAHGPSTTTSMA